MMFARRIDYTLFLSIILLILIGLVSVYSATLNLPNSMSFIMKQLLGLVIGLLIFFVVLGINYQFYKLYYTYLYVFSIILLLVVLIFGRSIHGTRAWIDLGYFAFQPSEVAKILFIITLAGYLDNNWTEMYNWQKLIVPVILLLGNIGLILLEPDFSGVIIYFPVFIVMLFCANVRTLHLSAIVLFASVAVGIPLIRTLLKTNIKYAFIVKIIDTNWQMLLVVLGIGLLLFLIWWFLNRFRIFIHVLYFAFIWGIIILGIASSYFVGHSMKEYQKKRLVAFIYPNIDPLGAGYNIIQSKIAVGSGRIFGKGLLRGTQGQLGFLPAQHTDFIFSLLGEEMGFFISFIVLILYFLLIWRGIRTAQLARDRYGSLLAIGITSQFAFYAIINIGMTVGLMPVTGLPLPFVSYGGSCLVASLMAIGIVSSVYLQRYIY